MRLRLNNEQKELLAPGLIDLANLALAALLFGTILSERPNWLIAIAGLTLYFVITSVALYLGKGAR